MLAIGTLSLIVAAGIPFTVHRLTGSTVNMPGESPKLHVSKAPLTTT
jgi:hypothetical protein